MQGLQVPAECAFTPRTHAGCVVAGLLPTARSADAFCPTALCWEVTVALLADVVHTPVQPYDWSSSTPVIPVPKPTAGLGRSITTMLVHFTHTVNHFFLLAGYASNTNATMRGTVSG